MTDDDIINVPVKIQVGDGELAQIGILKMDGNMVLNSPKAFITQIEEIMHEQLPPILRRTADHYETFDSVFSQKEE